MEISAIDILLWNNRNTLQAFIPGMVQTSVSCIMLSCTRATQIYYCFLIMFVLRSMYIWITSIKFLVLGPRMSGALCWHHGSQGLEKLCACRSEYFCNQKGGEVSIECCFWYINTSRLTEVGHPLRQVTLLWIWRTFFLLGPLLQWEKPLFIWHR
jgi:hypothetical protein